MPNIKLNNPDFIVTDAPDSYLHVVIKDKENNVDFYLDLKDVHKLVEKLTEATAGK
jgi:hypothetical protein